MRTIFAFLTYKIEVDIMKTQQQYRNELPKNIEDKIDKQISELKKMILDDYDNATADVMELNLFSRLQDIGKTSMEGYLKKKTTDLKK